MLCDYYMTLSAREININIIKHQLNISYYIIIIFIIIQIGMADYVNENSYSLLVENNSKIARKDEKRPIQSGENDTKSFK